MVQIKVKKVHEKAQLPKFNHSSDTGADMYSVEDAVIEPWSRKVLDTGIQIQVSELNQWLDIQVRSRSGLAAKNGVFVLNSPGTVDEAYTGNMKVILQNNSDVPFEVKVGDRIAQLVVSPRQPVEFVEVSELSETDRGSKGFGSSGVR